MTTGDVGLTTDGAGGGPDEIDDDQPRGDGFLLPFHEEIVDELLERDGLTVMAEGLGLSETLAGIIKALPRATAPPSVVDSALAAYLLPSTHAGGDVERTSGTPPSTSSRNHASRGETVGGGATLLLGLNDAQKRALRVHLKKLSPRTEWPFEITAECAGNERRIAYKKGGPLFVTTRIAAVDILSERLPPRDILGVVVCNAHRVTDFSGEAFVIRLFRAGNRTGFVRALTDRPGDLVRGFNSVERGMKALMVRRLNIWPRFHLGVRACLDAHAPEVVELRQPLTPATKKIQDAIIEVMHACMSELKKSKHVDTSELTLEAGLHKSFDRILQRQLDPVWHSVSRKLKQIVYDLRTLRNLATYLLRYDSVTFLRYLETLRVAEGRESVWLYTDAAHVIFEQAKRRVYALKRSVPAGPAIAAAGGSKRTPASEALDDDLVEVTEVAAPESMRPETELETILEPMPKWPLLEEIVEEVRVEKKKLRARMFAGDEKGKTNVVDRPGPSSDFAAEDAVESDFASHAGPGGAAYTPTREERFGQGPLLVVAKDDATANQLTHLLRLGSARLMRAVWAEYLERQRIAGTVGAAVASRGGRGGRGRGRSSTSSASKPSSGGRGKASASKPMSRMDRMRAAMMGEESVTASGGSGGGRGSRGVRGRPSPNSTAGLAGGGTPAERAAVAAAASSLARETARRARAAAAPAAAAAAKAGHKTATGDLDLAGPPSSPKPAKRRKTTAAVRKGNQEKTTLQTTLQTPDDDADADDDVLIVGETRRFPDSNATDRTTFGDDSYYECALHADDTDVLLASRGVYVASLSDRGGVLAAVNPSFIVVYDPDAAFIREIETHKASRPGAPMRVYFLVHDTSLEEQSYLSSVRYETAAFDALIRAKQHMVIPAEQEGRVNGGVGVLDDSILNLERSGVRAPHGAHDGLMTVDGPHIPKSTLAAHLVSGPRPLPLPQLAVLRDVSRDARALDTRRRGGQPATPSKLEVVVDVREFMSSLPSILHQSGFALKPATIEVGDYVLSPDICVERKALPDLVSSLQSGRLYNQAEAMCKHYKIPVLLIEFEREKSFALQALGDMGSEIHLTSTQSRLCLLVLAFPRLRLMWSRSLHATAEMFRAFKVAEPEPTVDAAVAIGAPRERLIGGSNPGGRSGLHSGDAVIPQEEPFNQPAIDVLRRLPGITEGNYRRVLDAVECLADLADVSQPDLAVILGDARQAKTLFEFIHAPFPIRG
jgi:DNA excision repair protein ERCC-4